MHDVEQGPELAWVERALAAAWASVQRAFVSDAAYFAQLYDDHELGAIFGEREFRVADSPREGE